MKKNCENWKEEYSMIYRNTPLPKRPIEEVISEYIETIKLKEEKFSKYEDKPYNKYQNVPLETTIGRWKESIEEIERRHNKLPVKCFPED